MNLWLELLLIVAFFGGMVLGVRLVNWPFRRFLRDEPVLNREQFRVAYPHLQWMAWVDIPARFLSLLAGVLVLYMTGSWVTMCMFGGLIFVLWVELPYPLLAILTGVWIDRPSRYIRYLNAIPTGRTREAGLFMVGLTAACTAVMFGVAALVG